MKNFISTSIASIVLLAAAPAFAENWFETDGFKKNHGADWSAKFTTAHKALKDAQAANKTAAEALKAAGKDKAKRAEANTARAAAQKAAWEAEQAWLKLHQEWRAYELPKQE